MTSEEIESRVRQALAEHEHAGPGVDVVSALTEMVLGVIEEAGEWEYGSAGYCFDNEVNRRCYFVSSQPWAVIKHARDWHSNDNNPDNDRDDRGHLKNLRKRHTASPWLPVEEVPA